MFIHHMEEMLGNPCYRYEKYFRENIDIDEDDSNRYGILIHVGQWVFTLIMIGNVYKKI